MNVFVCVKQVPDTSEVEINPETNTLVREGVPSILNPFDENALEAGLQLKEEGIADKVIAISMGPPQAKEALKKCVAMGADEAYLLSDKAFAGADTWATSYTLSKAIETIDKFDLVLCGKEAIDGDTAQVGPGIAEHLDIPQVTFVQSMLQITQEEIMVERLTEGITEKVKTELPALLTVEKSINEPRYPSIKGILKSNKVEIPTLEASDINIDESLTGLKGSPTEVRKIFLPKPRKKGEIITDDPDVAAQKLVSKILDLKIVS